MSAAAPARYTDGLAKNAMGLIARNIRTACAEPGNRAAREAMMLGATTAGMAFSNASVALVHGMSRPIGAFFHVPHGLSNAMLLPEITAFSAPAALDRYADCARAMGVADEGEGSQGAVARLLDELRRLNQDLQGAQPQRVGHRPRPLRELLPVMAGQALASGSPANNPLVPSSDQIIELYRRVYEKRKISLRREAAQMLRQPILSRDCRHCLKFNLTWISSPTRRTG